MNCNNLSTSHYTQYKKLINSDITKEYFTDFVNTTLNENHIIIVLEDEQKNAIGSGTLLTEQKLTYGGCKMGHIENVLIDEKFRGKGHGERLVEELLNLAKSCGCYRVDLNCNSELENFYEKNGFQKKHICMNLYFKENFR